MYTLEDLSEEFYNDRQTYMDAFISLWPTDELSDNTRQILYDSFTDLLKNPEDFEMVNVSDTNNYFLTVSKTGNTVSYIFLIKVSPNGDLIPGNPA